MLMIHFFDTVYSSNSNVCTIWKGWILTKSVEQERFYWNNPSHSVWPWWWRSNGFEKTESLTQRCVCVGCLLNSDQAHRLLCLKEYVRVSDLTLPRQQLTRSEWILVYLNTSFFWESSATTKIIAKKSWKWFLRRATNVTFSKFRGWYCKWKLPSVRFQIN